MSFAPLRAIASVLEQRMSHLPRSDAALVFLNRWLASGEPFFDLLSMRDVFRSAQGGMPTLIKALSCVLVIAALTLGPLAFADSDVVLPRPSLIHVTASAYGGIFNGSTCDALAIVKARCEGHTRCAVDVNDSVCPPEKLPNFGLIRTLKVEYQCTSETSGRTGAAEGPGRLWLSCAKSDD